jgi:hypothetical protein
MERPGCLLRPALLTCNSKGENHGQVLPGVAIGSAGNSAGADLFLYALTEARVTEARATLNHDAGRCCCGGAIFFFNKTEQSSKRAIHRSAQLSKDRMCNF